MKYQWHFEVVWENFPIMLSGIGLTIALSVLSMLAGAILGMVIALARLSPWAAFAASRTAIPSSSAPPPC